MLVNVLLFSGSDFTDHMQSHVVEVLHGFVKKSSEKS